MPLSFSNMIVAIVAAALIACSSASNPFDNHFGDLLDHNMVSRAQTEYVAGSFELFDTADVIPGRLEFSVSNSNTCEYAAQSQSVQTDSCIAYQDISFKVQLVADGCHGASIQYFHDSDCTLFAGSKAIDASKLACKRVSSDTGANHYYSSTSCHANAEVASVVTTLDEAVPSAEPTAEPTSRPPTAAPTTTQPHLVEFKATQTISGITLADYNADLETNELVLQKTVISVMPGVELTDLYDWTVTEGTSRRRLSNHIVTSLRALTRGFTTLADSIDLSYTVRTETQMSAETLQALLEDSVDNGTFNENLQALAEEADAEDLLDATSGPVTTSAVDSNSDSSSNKLSGGAVAGIVIGVVFGVILLALIAYYFVAGNHGKAANTGAPREGDYTVAL